MLASYDLKAWAFAAQWRRGLRAGLAVGSAMLVCHAFNLPAAGAALGAFDSLLVDNGGPYRTRLATMLTTLLGGSVALILGAILPKELAIVVPVTMAVCFVTIFARVIAQPMASSSVLIVVLYFAGLGGAQHTLRGALFTVALVLAGGAWAMLLSLFFWPLDPFRPARLAVSATYLSLANLSAELAAHVNDEVFDSAIHAAHEGRRRHRLRVEEARLALSATSARAPSRTNRARNLTVLLETSDMLLARTIRLTELTEVAQGAQRAASRAQIVALATWLSGAERAVAEALEQRPPDEASSFARDGSQRLQFLTRRREQWNAEPADETDLLLRHIATESGDALLEIEVIFDAVRSLWTGAEAPQTVTDIPDSPATPRWLESLRANWTLDSVMLRHALRIMVVGVVDVVVMRLIHINHGFWLPMTSIILMQPYSAGTQRKSLQRVTGTILGGILAAVLAAAVPDQLALTFVITALSVLTLATFTVDYALYCLFLTPTFVLLSLPHPHDWQYAGIRVGLTLVGAAIAVSAMRLLWPQRAEAELSHLLLRAVATDAAYLRATLRFWQTPRTARRTAERSILAPARRACGLASNDAEEAVDRVMQEPHLRTPFRSAAPTAESALIEQSLTFATYLRRLTQSITTLALLGEESQQLTPRLEAVANRLDLVAVNQPGSLSRPQFSQPQPSQKAAPSPIIEEQLQRIERQASVLERAAQTMHSV